MSDHVASHPPRLVVGAAVVDDLGRPTQLLTARRTEPAALAGGWEFPGGKVEPGESLDAALHRELAEELTVDVELGAEVTGPVHFDDATGWPLRPGWVMRVRLARVTDGVPRLVVHDALRWLGPTQLYDVPWLSANLPIVRAVQTLMT